LGYGRGCGAGPRCEKTRPRVTGRSTRYLYRWEEKESGVASDVIYAEIFRGYAGISDGNAVYRNRRCRGRGGAIAARVMNAAKMLPVARMFCPFPYSLPSRCGIGVSGNVVRADR